MQQVSKLCRPYRYVKGEAYAGRLGGPVLSFASAAWQRWRQIQTNKKISDGSRPRGGTNACGDGPAAKPWSANTGNAQPISNV